MAVFWKFVYVSWNLCQKWWYCFSVWFFKAWDWVANYHWSMCDSHLPRNQFPVRLTLPYHIVWIVAQPSHLQGNNGAYCIPNADWVKFFMSPLGVILEVILFQHIEHGITFWKTITFLISGWVFQIECIYNANELSPGV